MMSAQDSQILATFATRVRHHFPKARIWAFGSRARGPAMAALLEKRVARGTFSALRCCPSGLCRSRSLRPLLNL
jgi:hypothetical protein